MGRWGHHTTQPHGPFPFIFLLVPTVLRGNAGRDAPASRFQKAKKVMIVQGFCPWTDTSGGFAPLNKIMK
jgi:hypothetical protein